MPLSSKKLTYFLDNLKEAILLSKLLPAQEPKPYLASIKDIKSDEQRLLETGRGPRLFLWIKVISIFNTTVEQMGIEKSRLLRGYTYNLTHYAQLYLALLYLVRSQITPEQEGLRKTFYDMIDVHISSLVKDAEGEELTRDRCLSALKRFLTPRETPQVPTDEERITSEYLHKLSLALNALTVQKHKETFTLDLAHLKQILDTQLPPSEETPLTNLIKLSSEKTLLLQYNDAILGVSKRRAASPTDRNTMQTIRNRLSEEGRGPKLLVIDIIELIRQLVRNIPLTLSSQDKAFLLDRNTAFEIMVGVYVWAKLYLDQIYVKETPKVARVFNWARGGAGHSLYDVMSGILRTVGIPDNVFLDPANTPEALPYLKAFANLLKKPEICETKINSTCISNKGKHVAVTVKEMLEMLDPVMTELEKKSAAAPAQEATARPK